MHLMDPLYEVGLVLFRSFFWPKCLSVLHEIRPLFFSFFHQDNVDHRRFGCVAASIRYDLWIELVKVEFKRRVVIIFDSKFDCEGLKNAIDSAVFEGDPIHVRLPEHDSYCVHWLYIYHVLKAREVEPLACGYLAIIEHVRGVFRLHQLH